MKNVMVNNGLVEVVKVLDNGVEVIKNNLTNDFVKAQNMLNITRATRNFDAIALYEEREYNFFENTYSVKVEREEDFQAFKKLLGNDTCYDSKIDGLRDLYNKNEYSFEEYINEVRIVQECKCEKCEFIRHVKFDNWKTGMIDVSEFNDYIKEYKTRSYKLGKYMNKLKVSQSVIDFYATQIKTEKPVYLTISSKVQFITGMSNYAKPRSWNGYNGTSCQDTRHGGDSCQSLAGAIADDKLYIAFLHDELEDLNDMTNKMLARTLMRPIEVGCEIALIPINYYGGNETEDLLNYALKQLRELLIYSMDVVSYNSHDSFSWHTEYVSECAEIEVIRSEHVRFSEYVNMTCECPMCSGSGKYTVTATNDRDEEFENEVECPLCEGEGECEQEVYVDHESYIDVTINEVIYTYADDNSYYDFDMCDGTYMFKVNDTMIQEDIDNIERND